MSMLGELSTTNKKSIFLSPAEIVKLSVLVLKEGFFEEDEELIEELTEEIDDADETWVGALLSVLLLIEELNEDEA